MNKAFSSEPEKGQNHSSSQTHRDEATFPESLPNLISSKQSIEPLSREPKVEQDEIDKNLPSKTLKPRITAAWASAIVMLPILAVGTATYYFGTQGINQQTILARRADNTGIAETELEQQKQLLAFLLMGTGTTALLAGLLAALWTSRTIRCAIASGAVTTKEIRHQEERSQRLQEYVQHLSQSPHQDILAATVAEARRVLNCDRVVVYSLNQDRYGVIVAESVASGWTRALGLTIKDPCFEARYLEKYRDGRVRALDDIYAADMTPCYIEQLEQLEVQANLVTPIINEDNLFGLLVAHQCGSPRTWQQEEIEFLTQLAKRVGFALNNAKLLAEATQLKQEAQTEAEWTQRFTDVVRYIRQSLKQEDILDIAVEEIRRVLSCDRVVVYSLNQDRYGVVVAESVAPGWTRALGRTIEDPCFEARYLEQYRDGRVRALDNIYTAGMTPCYLEQLEQLEVKANLVTPILNEGKLFGLLVAHQCREPRAWQQYEIRWMTQIATQVGFALDNAKLLAAATQLKQEAQTEAEWTQRFTEAVRYIRQSLKQKDILDIAVEEIRRVLSCDRVVVYSLNSDRYGVVVAESVAPGWTRALGRTIEDPCFEARYLEQYRDGRVRALNDIYAADMTPCYLEQLEQLEVKANLVTPILNEGKLFGLLVAHQCREPRAWQQYEIRWMTQIATQVGFALDNAKLLAAATQLKQEAQTEAEWTQRFTEAVRYIRQSLKQEDILEIAVEEIRRVLACDRVVVYSLNSDRYGVVVAESVALGWTRALGRTIEDPCFEARYLEQYRDGRVRALDNIYTAGMSACYLEQLEQLEVKANLVTQILNEGKLFGLLVAHQCREPRAWQQYEIRWVTQIATQVGFALDNAKLLRQLEQESILTRSLKNFPLSLRERINKNDFFKVTVEEARRAINTERVIVYSFDDDWKGTVIAESILPGLPKAYRAKIKDPCFARDYAEKYRYGRVQTIDNIYETDLTDCHREQLEAFAVKASLVAPIIQGDRLFGLLIAHQCSSPRHWQPDEIDLFAQLAVQVGLALDRAKLLQVMTTTDEPQLLQDSSKALQNLSAEVNRQSEAIADFITQIQAITDSPKDVAAIAAPVKYRVSRTAADLNQIPLSETMPTVRQTITEATEKVKQLHQSSEKLFELGHLVNDLKKVAETIEPRGEQRPQSSLVSFAETVRPLTQRLAKQTEKIEALMGEIAIEINEDIDAIDPNISEVFVRTEFIQDERQFEPTTLVNLKTNALAGKAQAKTPDVVFMNQFILQLATLASQISAQSAAVTETLDKLAALTNKLL